MKYALTMMDMLLYRLLIRATGQCHDVRARSN